MKNLNSYIKESKEVQEIKATDQVITLEGLEKEVAEKLTNLEGRPIYEWGDLCGTCCCEEPCPCDCEAAPMTVTNPFIYFYSENEVVAVLDGGPKVQNLINMHYQFGNRFKFQGDENIVDEPLYFYSNGLIQNQMIRQQGDAPDPNAGQYPQIFANLNKKLYDFVKDITKTHKLNNPIVLTKLDGTVQLYFTKYAGTNGKEGSIKNSLADIVKILNKLDSSKEITWSQVLDVSIDNLDDVYSFLITCTVDPNEFHMSVDDAVKVLDKQNKNK